MEDSPHFIQSTVLQNGLEYAQVIKQTNEQTFRVELLNQSLSAWDAHLLAVRSSSLSALPWPVNISSVFWAQIWQFPQSIHIIQEPII